MLPFALTITPRKRSIVWFGIIGVIFLLTGALPSMETLSSGPVTLAMPIQASSSSLIQMAPKVNMLEREIVEAETELEESPRE